HAAINARDGYSTNNRWRECRRRLGSERHADRGTSPGESGARMSTFTHVAHVPQLDDDAVADNGLQDLIDHAAVTKSPPPSWYRTMGHNPEVAQAFSQYWDLLHRGGRV